MSLRLITCSDISREMEMAAVISEPMGNDCPRIDTMKRGLAGLMTGILAHINSVPTPSKASAPDVPLDWNLIATLCEERIGAVEGSLAPEVRAPNESPPNEPQCWPTGH